MKQFNRINIDTKLASNPFLLFLIWLLLIISPYFILSEVIETILNKSEKTILSKAKIQLINDIYQFLTNLTSTSYINSKLSAFNIPEAKEALSVQEITKKLEKHTNSKITAIFIYDKQSNNLDSYISKEAKNDLKMFGRKSMKNMLSDFASDSYKKSDIRNNVNNFAKLINAAGGINIQPNTAFPILSGKVKLGRMVGYLKTIKNKNGNKVFFVIFKDQDIPLKAIVDYSIKNTPNNCSRELITLGNNSRNDSKYYNLQNEFFKFYYDENSGLSIISKVSDYFLIRLGTLNTFYPLNIKGLSNNEPILKVSIPKNKLVHPMRKTIKQLRLPSIVLIVLFSFGFIKVGLLGYSTNNIKILGRVALCVSGAVLLPFTSFLVLAYYNQSFEKDYEINEIQSFTQIQTDMINKAIESYLTNRELVVSELRENIFNLNSEQLHNYLNVWFYTSGANAISYNYNGSKEIQIPPQPSLISQLGLEVKKIFDLSINHYLEYNEFNGINSFDELQKKFRFSPPHQLSSVILNIGKIYCSVPNEPDCLYSIFPIFEDEKNAKKVIGSIVIKFDTKEIIKNVEAIMPDLFRIKQMGDYSIYNTIIPVNSDGNLFINDKGIWANDNGEDIKNKLEQISFDRSKISWVDSSSINTGLYLNSINSIVLSRASKTLSNSKIDNHIEMRNIISYAFLMVITLSVALSGIIVAPIKRLKTASEKIAEGDYTNKIEWKSGDEFENLCNGFNEMTNALAQKEKMTSYVSKEVINEVSSNIEHQLQPGGERIPVSVLFCSLKGKKELSSYSPEEVTKIISCLIDAVDEISTRYSGQIDKLIEDTVMVVFRQINKEENITLNACKTALEINKRLQIELPDFKINMGVASGEAVSGKIGSRNGKLDYTVIGNPVNLAARLKVQAYKAKNTGILICPNSIRKLNGVGRLNYIERMAIKGRTNRTFPLYELIEIRKKT